MAGPEQVSGHPQLTDTLVARRRLAGRLRRTPLVASPTLSERHGAAVHLKCEHQQITGAFKLRGATNAVLALPPDQRAKGVTAASTGNHGRALAHAAREAGIPCIVCMSALVPANKVEAIAALGAEARIVGLSQDDAQVEVDRLVAEEGRVALPPFDHADIIAGQGTLGLEMLEDLPEAETLLVPLSGGGLIAARPQPLCQRGTVNRAGTNGIAANTLSDEIARNRHGQPNHRRLGGAVSEAVWRGHHRGHDRSDIDDRALARSEHSWQESADRIFHRADIDPETALEIARRRVKYGAIGHPSRAIDQNADLRIVRGKPLGRSRIRNVEPRASHRWLACKGPGQFSVLQVRDEDMSALPQIGLRYGMTDALCRAGDEAMLACEPVRHDLPFIREIG